MVDRWIEDATDEEVLQYINHCSPSTPHQWHLGIDFATIDEALSLLHFIVESLQQQKAAFVSDVQNDLSSGALFNARTFKILLDLQTPVLAAVKDYAVGRWTEETIANLPCYPHNVPRW